MSDERCVVRDECVCEMLCEMNEMSGVRTATPNAIYTATRQTRMPGRHHRKIFASPIGAPTPNTLYTQHGAKPACQEDINAIFLHLLLAELHRTQFTHSTAPNPHARKTSTQYFCISYWHRYPGHSLRTARRQTRMPGSHQRKMFASLTLAGV